MSLFGKVLALLNVFGAGALIYFASIDYGKRTAWAESALRHEVVLRGLPLDQKEADKQHQPRARLLDTAILNDLFKDVGGSPVNTQHEEITRLRGELDANIAAAAGQGKDKPRGFEKQTYALARILRPLVNAIVDRDQVDAALYYVANNQRADELRDRHRKALKDTLNRPPELDKIKPAPTFAQSFQLAL